MLGVINNPILSDWENLDTEKESSGRGSVLNYKSLILVNWKDKQELDLEAYRVIRSKWAISCNTCTA